MMAKKRIFSKYCQYSYDKTYNLAALASACPTKLFSDTPLGQHFVARVVPGLGIPLHPDTRFPVQRNIPRLYERLDKRYIKRCIE